MTLTPTQIHGRLDTKGLLEDSYGPGAYSLKVKTPDSVEGVARAFLAVGDATPPDDTMQRLTSGKVAYVGGSGNVYDRLQDHGEAKVRQATFLRAFDVVDVIDVWPSEEPFREERARGRELAQDGFVCWCDGQVV